MKRRKIYHFFFIILTCFISILSSVFISPSIFSKNININSNAHESHLINGVTYVAQIERNFCVYACFTMVLNYMGLNTTLNEMLFYAGVGYTHSYNVDKRLPSADIYQRFDFLYHVYGVSSQSWWPSTDTLSKDELWEQYYTRMKENITNDIPIITRVDPFSLPSLRNQFKVSDEIWNIIFPTGYHVIVVIGYNDTNQTICYNDPNAGFYGDDRFGDHAWISISEFRKIQEKINSYHLNIYTQKSQPLLKNDAFENAFKKNIENLTGGLQPNRRYYGLSASQQMQIDFSSGENNSQKTCQLYKKYGGNGINITLFLWMQKLCSITNPHRPNIFDILLVGKTSPFTDIAAVKNDVAEYLQKCSIQKNICTRQANLLRNESKLWYELSQFYLIFLKKGMFLSEIRAMQIMKRMDSLIAEIIEIEEALIDQ